MDKKEQWAEEVLNSLKGIKRTSPKDDLFDKIITSIPKNIKNEITPLKYIGWFAIAASVVISLNIYTLKLYKNNVNTNEETENQISLLSDYTFKN